MGTLLLKLDSVGNDEADDVRQLLSDHHIEFHETPQNSFGMALPAIWIHDRDQVRHARRLLREYRTIRSRRLQVERLARRHAGEVDTPARRLADSPTVIIVLGIIAVGLVYLAALLIA